MKTNRRAFLALGAAAATGLVRGQSTEVRRRVQKKDPDPLRDVAPVTDAELESAIKTLEETTLRDEEARAAAWPNSSSARRWKGTGPPSGTSTTWALS